MSSAEPVSNDKPVRKRKKPSVKRSSIKRKTPIKKSFAEIQLNKALELLGFVSWYDLDCIGMINKCNSVSSE